MRLKERFIPRTDIINSVDTYEIIEEYPEDKYLPSCLVYAKYNNYILHIQMAIDIKNNAVTMVTVYKPTLDNWEKDFKTRRKL